MHQKSMCLVHSAFSQWIMNEAFAQSLSFIAAMEEDDQIEKIIDNFDMQNNESLESPFNKLAPEVTGHILSFLKDEIGSLMSASGVCRLWRELVDWRHVKQLHLDFEHMHINKVSIERHKWAPALESLLPKVKITSIWVTLPYKLPKQHKKRGKYGPSLFWPLHLLDCGVAIHSLITNHRASFSSVTVANIQGCPCNAEFEFVSHLLELCPSLSVLKLTLTVDQFPWSSLQWALRGKSVTSLSVTLCHIGSPNSAEHMAQLCQTLAPGTLKTLTLITNVYHDPKHDADHTFPRFGTVPTFSRASDDDLLCLDRFFSSLQANAACFSALEHLHFGARDLAVSQQFMGSIPNLTNFADLVHKVLPKLKNIKFNVPGCDVNKWAKFYIMLDMLSIEPFNHPLNISLTSSYCKIFNIYAQLIGTAAGGLIHLTKEGFNHSLDPPVQFVYKRLSRTTSPSPLLSCPCPVCGSEYNWIKGELLKHLRGPVQFHKEWISDTYMFSCQFDRLKADLVVEFPSLEFALLKKGVVMIKADGKQMCSYMCNHNAQCIGNLCGGCGMMTE